MEVETVTLENLRIQHAHLDAVIKEEESHIWKNLVHSALAPYWLMRCGLMIMILTSFLKIKSNW